VDARNNKREENHTFMLSSNSFVHPCPSTSKIANVDFSTERRKRKREGMERALSQLKWGVGGWGSYRTSDKTSGYLMLLSNKFPLRLLQIQEEMIESPTLFLANMKVFATIFAKTKV
jgi:hypothetical protein